MRYVEVTKALYDYEARTEDELSVKEDDILYVIEKEDEDWWKAELKQPNAEQQGPIGLVPASYLEEITPLGKVRAEFDYEAQQEEELSFQEGEEMTLLETDDPDWYLVKLKNGQIGLAPSNYVQVDGEQFDDAQEQYQESIPAALSPPIPTPPVQAPVSIPPPPVRPILSQPTGSATTLPREIINDDAQSWNVYEYDAAKKKKKKSKGNLFVGNGMLCYGSETDKSLPVQQYPILDVTKYLYDGKNLHIEVDGTKQAVLDFQASSKSEAKAILAKIADSAKAAQVSNTHLNQPDRQMAAPAAAIPPRTGSSRIEHYSEPEPEEEESNCVPKWGISIYAFQAEGGDELTVKENEQIYVLDYERTDGWWRVQTVDGDTGLVPSSYVQFDDDDEENNKAQHTDNIRQQREEEELALQQQRIAEEQARELQRKREQEERDRRRREEEKEDERRRQEEEHRRQDEENRRREEENRRREEESRRKEDQRRQEEAVREKQRQSAEAAKRAEQARQRQIEEEYKKKEADRKAQLARSSSQSKKYQDLPKPDPKKVRTWTDRSGSFKVEAQFIDFHNGKLRLHKLNGVKIDVPVEKMCAEDINWVENHTKGYEEPEVIPAMPPRPKQVTTTPPPPPPAPVQPPAPSQPPQKKFNERWDWFDWFMVVGIPMQASLQYASAFKADKLDDGDIQKLTHKQMKGLGIKEEHVRRIERYIETGQPEDLTEEEEDKKKKEKDQISKDEELARKLQKEWEATESSQNKSSSNGRPRPSVSAPKDVHPDLLDFIGTQLSSDTGKGKAPEQPKGDLLGFNDDAWAPRSDASPSVTLAPTKVVAAPPQPTGPTPEQIQAQEAERRRIQEEEQIQKIQLLSLQKQTNEQKKQLEDLQQLTHQQIELQKQIAMQTGTQQQQHMLQLQAQQAQLQQAQLQQQLAPQFPQLQTSYTNQFNGSQPTGFNSQPTGLNSQPTGFNSQPTGFNSQPTGFNSQPTGFNSQPTGFNNQVALSNGLPRPSANSSLIQDPSLGQWQPNNQQPQPTGFQPNALVQQPQNAWQGLQPQMTGFPSTNNNNVLPPPLAPSTAGQQNIFNNNGPQNIGIQPTGRHWNNSTPANPFGSPTLSPLQAQMTGVQFSTPNPQAFNSNPLQQQPQMTGFQQPAGNSVFTPQGSMQYGQSAFPSQRPW